MPMGRRRNSVMTSLWLDQDDWNEITQRSQDLHLSKAEVIRRMIRWAITAAKKGHKP